MKEKLEEFVESSVRQFLEDISEIQEDYRDDLNSIAEDIENLEDDRFRLKDKEYGYLLDKDPLEVINVIMNENEMEEELNILGTLRISFDYTPDVTYEIDLDIRERDGGFGARYNLFSNGESEIEEENVRDVIQVLDPILERHNVESEGYYTPKIGEEYVPA